MADLVKLRIIKIVHTLVWLFYNVVIFYMLYAAITNKIDCWLWIGYGLVLLEGLILLICKFYCPLTILARKYSNEQADNFDICLPNWLAKHNKRIYTTLVFIIMIITIFQLLIR